MFFVTHSVDGFFVARYAFTEWSQVNDLIRLLASSEGWHLHFDY